ncbi:MAG: putative Ig domain-containing protein [Steroidobacteraceae bacterium]
MSGCKPGDAAATTGNTPAAPTDPASTTPPAPTTPTPPTTPTTPTANSAPVISGSPAASVAAGAVYAFTPSSSDANGDALAFSIANKPAWAAFATATGALSGTPTAGQVGTYSGIAISVSDGKAAAVSLPAFTITVTAAANVAPTITGVPSTAATVGDDYSFTPTALDANQDPLTFSAQNLPSWASINTRTGAISGRPSAAGTHSGIVVTVSDGTATASLAGFTITVAAAASTGNGTYAGFTYAVPTTRPFISLNHYNTGTTSAAFTRLKGQVDDAVTVTNGISASATYDQLVTALNPGHYGYTSTDSVIMYRLTGDQRYIQQAIRMVDLFVTSENARIAAGSGTRVASDSYLEAGFFIEQVALAYDYGYSLLTPAQRTAWSAYAEQALFNIWNPNSASWGGVARTWTGWSISDPGNNYHYSFLKATQLWALASQNRTWFTHLQNNKYPPLVSFFYQLPGGGSREGTGYGTALGNLFEDYAYWKGSTGEDLAAYSAHARNTIDYWIHATVPTFDYFASIGDQSRSAMTVMFDYQRKLMAEAVALYQGTAQGQRGTWWLNRVRVTDGGNGFLTGRMRYNYDYKYDLLAMAASELAPTSLMYDATGTGALFARSDWGTTASWMHTVAGPYDQSHAHNDQGSFSFYRNGWLTLTSNAFSRSGINQGTDVHNVIRFMYSGAIVPQNESTSSKTVSDDGSTVRISETLTPAYSRNSTRVSNWLRELTYERTAHRLSVHDYCTIGTGVSPVWQLHTPVQPVRQSDGSYLAGSLRITTTLPASPTVTVVNMTSSAEFSGGYRLEITNPAGGCEFQVTLQAQ